LKILKISILFLIILLGTLPITLWTSFSILYYGFPFPNTAYAKLNTGIPIIYLIKQGTKYYYNSLSNDPVCLLIIISTITLAISSRIKIYIITSTGIFLYMMYIVRIGGDFMSGRFFSVPFLLSTILLLNIYNKTELYKILTIFVLVIIISSPFSPIRITMWFDHKFTDHYGIADEKGYYYQRSSLLNSLNYNDMSDNIRTKIDTNKKNLTVSETIGYSSFYLNKDIYIIDRLGLADPLLSKLPVPCPKQWNLSSDHSRWRIGHFTRSIPKGYKDSIRAKKNLIKDPNLKIFYDKLLIITRGNIFDYERLKNIYLINTGAFHHLLESYLANRENNIDEFSRITKLCPDSNKL
jgi:arabinofuranosyltransferase